MTKNSTQISSVQLQPRKTTTPWAASNEVSALQIHLTHLSTEIRM
ncbi:hypothetical protein CP061683_1561 [Chlamydia psittaci 06-1683]|nr:hypothetical protein CP061683_1561 [Chlamydia psittaci 06-1683]